MKTIIIGILSFSFVVACGARNPKVAEEQASPSAKLSHATFTSCETCHGAERPSTPVHSSGEDCVGCHAFPTWEPTF